MQRGFYIDQTRCTGCYTCIVACKDWHDVPAGSASWMRVKTVEKGKYPDLFVGFLPMNCFQCEDPACVKACPVSAITKRKEDGIVVVDRETCLGKDQCQLCFDACPYEAPQFGDEDNPKMQKCDLCVERWQENKKPICVDGCPMRALDAGTMDELKKKYGDKNEAEMFKYDKESRPSVVFKPKKDPKDREVQRIEVSPITARTK